MIKRLRLKLDELNVDTFSTTSVPRAGGTVLGHQESNFEVCEPESLACTNGCTAFPQCGGGSAGGTCDWTCGDTCQGTCVTCNIQQTCMNWSCSPCEPQEPKP